MYENEIHHDDDSMSDSVSQAGDQSMMGHDDTATSGERSILRSINSGDLSIMERSGMGNQSILEHSAHGDQFMLGSSGGSSSHYMNAPAVGERSSSLGCKRTLLKQGSSGYLSSDSFHSMSNTRRYGVLHSSYKLF